jgi:ArsR family transcriptional regulator
MQRLAVLPTICCAPETPALAAAERHALASRFHALADPTRVAIVNRLAAHGETCVCGFGDLGLAQPTISHHLKILREAGLVEAERRGTWSWYRLVPDAIAGLRRTLGG